MEKLENNENKLLNKGEFVKNIISQYGIKFVTIANKLGITRNTLYVKLLDPNLSDEFIKKIGLTIGYDFSNIISTKENNFFHENEDYFYSKNIEKKYSELLEKHNQILKFIIKISTIDDFREIKREIDSFMKKI